MADTDPVATLVLALVGENDKLKKMLDNTDKLVRDLAKKVSDPMELKLDVKNFAESLSAAAKKFSRLARNVENRPLKLELNTKAFETELFNAQQQYDAMRIKVEQPLTLTLNVKAFEQSLKQANAQFNTLKAEVSKQMVLNVPKIDPHALTELRAYREELNLTNHAINQMGKRRTVPGINVNANQGEGQRQVIIQQAPEQSHGYEKLLYDSLLHEQREREHQRRSTVTEVIGRRLIGRRSAMEEVVSAAMPVRALTDWEIIGARAGAHLTSGVIRTSLRLPGLLTKAVLTPIEFAFNKNFSAVHKTIAATTNFAGAAASGVVDPLARAYALPVAFAAQHTAQGANKAFHSRPGLGFRGSVNILGGGLGLFSPFALYGELISEFFTKAIPAVKHLLGLPAFNLKNIGKLAMRIADLSETSARIFGNFMLGSYPVLNAAWGVWQLHKSGIINRIVPYQGLLDAGKGFAMSSLSGLWEGSRLQSAVNNKYIRHPFTADLFEQGGPMRAIGGAASSGIKTAAYYGLGAPLSYIWNEVLERHPRFRAPNYISPFAKIMQGMKYAGGAVKEYGIGTGEGFSQLATDLRPVTNAIRKLWYRKINMADVMSGLNPTSKFPEIPSIARTANPTMAFTNEEFAAQKVKDSFERKVKSQYESRLVRAEASRRYADYKASLAAPGNAMAGLTGAALPAKTQADILAEQTQKELNRLQVRSAARQQMREIRGNIRADQLYIEAGQGRYGPPASLMGTGQKTSFLEKLSGAITQLIPVIERLTLAFETIMAKGAAPTAFQHGGSLLDRMSSLGIPNPDFVAAEISKAMSGAFGEVKLMGDWVHQTTGHFQAFQQALQRATRLINKGGAPAQGAMDSAAAAVASAGAGNMLMPSAARITKPTKQLVDNLRQAADFIENKEMQREAKNAQQREALVKKNQASPNFIGPPLPLGKVSKGLWSDDAGSYDAAPIDAAIEKTIKAGSSFFRRLFGKMFKGLWSDDRGSVDVAPVDAAAEKTVKAGSSFFRRLFGRKSPGQSDASPVPPPLQQGGYGGQGGMLSWLVGQQVMQFGMTQLHSVSSNFMEFEQTVTHSMMRIQGASAKLSESVRYHLLEMSHAGVQSTADLAKGFDVLVRAQYSARDAVDLLGIAQVHATANGLSANDAALSLSTAFLALGLKTNDSMQNMVDYTRLSDLMTQASDNANVSVQEFAESLSGRGTESIRNLNLSLEDAVANLVTLAQMGIKGTAASSMLNRAYLQIEKMNSPQGGEHHAYASTLFGGNKLHDESGNLISINQFAVLLRNRLHGRSPIEIERAMHGLGLEGGRGGAQTLFSLADNFEKNKAAMQGSDGASARRTEQLLHTWLEQFKRFRNSIQTLVVEVGSKLLPVFEWVGSALEKGINWWSGLNSGLKNTSLSAVALYAALVPLGMAFNNTFGIAKSALSVLLAPLKAMWSIVSGITSEVISLSWTLIKFPFEAIYTVATSIAWIAMNIAPLVLGFGALAFVVATIAKGWSEVSDTGQKAWSTVKDSAGSAWAATSSYAANSVASMKETLEGWLPNIIGFFSNFQENTQVIFAWLRTNWHDVFEDIFQIVDVVGGNMMNDIIIVLRGATAIVTYNISDWCGIVVSRLHDAFDTVGQLWMRLVAFMGRTWGNFWDYQAELAVIKMNLASINPFATKEELAANPKYQMNRGLLMGKYASYESYQKSLGADARAEQDAADMKSPENVYKRLLQAYTEANTDANGGTRLDYLLKRTRELLPKAADGDKYAKMMLPILYDEWNKLNKMQLAVEQAEKNLPETNAARYDKQRGTSNPFPPDSLLGKLFAPLPAQGTDLFAGLIGLTKWGKGLNLKSPKIEGLKLTIPETPGNGLGGKDTSFWADPFTAMKGGFMNLRKNLFVGDPVPFTGNRDQTQYKEINLNRFVLDGPGGLAQPASVDRQQLSEMQRMNVTLTQIRDLNAKPDPNFVGPLPAVAAP